MTLLFQSNGFIRSSKSKALAFLYHVTDFIRLLSAMQRNGCHSLLRKSKGNIARVVKAFFFTPGLKGNSKGYTDWDPMDGYTRLPSIHIPLVIIIGNEVAYTMKSRISY